jgi:hypothetical protein
MHWTRNQLVDRNQTGALTAIVLLGKLESMSYIATYLTRQVGTEPAATPEG